MLDDLRYAWLGLLVRYVIWCCWPLFCVVNGSLLLFLLVDLWVLWPLRLVSCFVWLVVLLVGGWCGSRFALVYRRYLGCGLLVAIIRFRALGVTGCGIVAFGVVG